ncbi:helix-turn-helix domain-containing protein [Calidithermus chliarophilus]|uniref:helix-turn-helix domain-containing protein n=1 Tax=Calidithermus chliarophilus TaxID=52023 RepID=UPI00041B3AF5|nr:AraC family transcriptional regulator [Calidithermus chliarophilus]
MPNLRRLLRARDFLREAYHQPLNLPRIAAQANLSPHHFLRAYKRAFQETPHDTLTRLRLERAKTLLRQGELSVSEVCLEVGFESLSTFSGLFLREVGLPPSHYRKYATSQVYIPLVYRTLYVPACFLRVYGGPEPERNFEEAPLEP